MRLTTAILNPFNGVDKNRNLLPNYHTKQFDAWLSTEQHFGIDVVRFEFQKWQRDDICRMQVKADFGPIIIRVRNSTGLVILQQVMTSVITIGTDTYYQDNLAFSDPVFIEDGYYLMEIVGGSPALIVLESVIFWVQDSWPGTILLSYSNKFNNHIIWETGIVMTYRVDAVIVYDSPASVFTSYIDQPGAGQNVKGDAARLFKFYLGCQGGSPNTTIDKVDEILLQTDVTFDGKGFAKVPGSKWNTKKIDRYPWAQWNTDMRESENRREKIYETDGLQTGKVAMDYVISSKLFGPISGNPASDNSYTITKVS